MGRAMTWEATRLPTRLAASLPGFDGGFHAADIASDDGGDQRPADRDGFDQLHVRGLDHGVTGFHQAHVAASFD